MPAFDPVRDAAKTSPSLSPTLEFSRPQPGLNSPSLASPSLGKRPHLSQLLNAPTDEHYQPSLTPRSPAATSSLAHLLLHDDDKLSAVQPLQRTSYFDHTLASSSSRPSSSSSSSITQATATTTTRKTTTSPDMGPPSAIPYDPRRITPPNTVLVPMTAEEMRMYQGYIGTGAQRLRKRKRQRSVEPAIEQQPPAKKFAGDVGAVVDHYNSRPDVGVAQRQKSPIFGLKSFNNWVKSVLITRFTHPALEKSPTSPRKPGRGNAGHSAGKVLDMGCGKGGDLNKWSKARAREVVAVDIAAVSVEQARSRWETMRGNRYEAFFAALDCFTQPLTDAVPPQRLSVPFDVVSMQFCMHYAFETEAKVRCMLDNVSRWLRPGGVFVGTIPNAENLLDHLDAIPPGEELSFGNSVYKIRFEDREERPVFGHRYWFYLQDAVDDVPEYVVHWDNFAALAEEYQLHVLYKEEFHQFFEEHQDQQDFAQLLTRMNVVDANGESSMDEDQWEAANVYLAFAFEKR